MTAKPAAGVVYGAPEARQRALSYGIVLTTVLIGGIIAVVWIARFGITWIEASAFALFYVMSSIGQGIGLHRYFSHKSFRTSPAGRFALAALSTMAMQGSIINWVSDHRRHHAHTDQFGDAHSPHFDAHGRPLTGWRGLFYAQLGWLFDDNYSDPRIFAKDIVDDPVVQYFSRTRLSWYFISIIVLPGLYGYLLGGTQHILSVILIGGMLRAIVFSQAVLALNSIAHTYGRVRFTEMGGTSRNNFWLAIVLLGEGWHNNHHRFPRNAYSGLAWYEFDPLGRMITLGEKLGVFWDVVRIERAEQSVAKAA